jgi:hypothetical protein
VKTLMLMVAAAALVSLAGLVDGAGGVADSVTHRHADAWDTQDVATHVSAVCAGDSPTCEDVFMYELESGDCVTNLGRSCREAVAERQTAASSRK